MRIEHDQTWTVIDVFTDTPVLFGCELAFGMTEAKAINLANQLNEIDERRIVLSHPGQ